MRHFPFALLLAGLLIGSWTGAARADDVVSGPNVNEATPALPVFAAAGAIQGRDVDFAAERKEGTTIYLLVDYPRLSRPIGRYMKELDTQLGAAAADAAIVAVFRADEAEKAKEHLPRVQTSLQCGRTTWTVFPGTDGPDQWGLHDDADLTVVIAHDGVVKAAFGFVSVNDTLVEKTLAEVKKARAGS